MGSSEEIIAHPTRWWHRLANWLAIRGRYKRVPSLPNPAEVQIHRYFLFYGSKWWCPFGIALHRIVVDDIPVLHSHEWPHVLVVLEGGYTNFNDCGSQRIRPGMVRFSSHKTRHFIKLAKQESWSLIVVGPKSHVYGYTDQSGYHIRRDVFLFGRVTDTSRLQLTRAERAYLDASRSYYGN